MGCWVNVARSEQSCARLVGGRTARLRGSSSWGGGQSQAVVSGRRGGAVRLTTPTRSCLLSENRVGTYS